MGGWIQKGSTLSPTTGNQGAESHGGEPGNRDASVSLEQWLRYELMWAGVWRRLWCNRKACCVFIGSTVVWTLMKFKVSAEMIQFDNLRNDMKLTDSSFSDLTSAPWKASTLIYLWPWDSVSEAMDPWSWKPVDQYSFMQIDLLEASPNGTQKHEQNSCFC